DGIECLLKIIENKNNAAEGRIFNIGNPKNDLSIRELAEKLISIALTYPHYARQVSNLRIVEVDSKDYYGAGYQDISTRVPSIKNAAQHLNWQPTTDLNT